MNIFIHDEYETVSIGNDIKRKKTRVRGENVKVTTLKAKSEHEIYRLTELTTYIASFRSTKNRILFPNLVEDALS